HRRGVRVAHGGERLERFARKGKNLESGRGLRSREGCGHRSGLFVEICPTLRRRGARSLTSRRTARSSAYLNRSTTSSRVASSRSLPHAWAIAPCWSHSGERAL